MFSPVQLQANALLELRRRQSTGLVTESPYKLFQAKYFNDPAGFVRDCIKWEPGRGPYAYQAAALDDLSKHDRICERGPHGLGKTAFLAWVIHWFSLTRDGLDWKIPVTASAWRQLEKYLFPELHKWARRLDWKKIGRAPYDERGELLSLSLKLKTGEAFAMVSNNPELIEGAHADELLYIFDESKSIPDETWDAAEGAFTTGNVKWLAMSTPGDPAGRFYNIQKRKEGTEDWHVIYVTKDDCIQAGAMKADWAESRRRLWGESSPVYQNRVLGEFAEGAANGIIPLAWIEASNERWLAWQEAGFPGRVTSVGADIGGGEEGGDKSTIATIYDGVKVRELRVQDISDPNTATMALVGLISGVLEAAGRKQRQPANQILAVLDSVGVGLGALHRMRELGYNARGFVASKGTELRDKSGEFGFENWRSAAWWILREILDPDSGIGACLPPDDVLTGELTAPVTVPTSNDKIKVIAKEVLRSKLHRSTDYADAVLHGMIGPFLIEEEDLPDEYVVIHDR